MILGIDASRANKKKRTGVEWYSYFLIQEFKKIVPQDVKVVLYSPAPLREDLLPLPPNWKVEILNWLPRRFWTIFRFSCEMLWRKPDILFVPSHIVPFFPPKKTFTTIHDIGFKRFPESYGWLERCLQNFGVWRANKKAKTIFTISQFTKKELMDVYKIPENKIQITYLGYDGELYKKQENIDEILRKYNIQKPYLFYIGRLEKKKNIENMIEGFEIFSQNNPGYSLVLAGSKNSNFHTPYSKFHILKLGWVPEKDVPYLMNGAELFLYPSLYEGFGIPILEAMACGTPVITSNRASMPEIAGNAALLVNPDNPQEIADAIKKILQNPEIKDNLISRGIERCRQFSWRTCAEETLKQMFF